MAISMDMAKRLILIIMHRQFMLRAVIFCEVWSWHLGKRRRHSERRVRRRESRKYNMFARADTQNFRLFRLLAENDINCKDRLRMDINCFHRLCALLTEKAGLSDGPHVNVKEQVAIFLTVLAYHQKNSTVKFDFYRSGETDCLDALDGTYIDIHVSRKLHGRYRNRKGKITVNVFAACNQDTNFTHVLAGWEDSAADSRVLKDAIHQPNGFSILVGVMFMFNVENMFPLIVTTVWSFPATLKSLLHKEWIGVQV